MFSLLAKWVTPYLGWIKAGFLIFSILGAGFLGWTVQKWKHSHEEKAQVERQLAAVEEAISDHKKLNQAVMKLLLDYSGRMDTLLVNDANLEKALRNKKFVEVSSEINCTPPRITPALVECLRAAITGDPAHIAACDAIGMPQALP